MGVKGDFMTPDEYFSQPFFQDRFHGCAFAAFVEAAAENKHIDSEHVRELAYKYYEEGRR